jgi:hypothetical protein
MVKDFFQLSVYGNMEDPKGNPIPYFRQTQGTKFSKGAKRYHAWQQHLIDQFCAQNRGHQLLCDGKRLKPFTTEKESHGILIVKSYFGKLNHGDSENIRKGVADALYIQDKWLFGCDLFGFDKSSPRVMILAASCDPLEDKSKIICQLLDKIDF